MNNTEILAKIDGIIASIVEEIKTQTAGQIVDIIQTELNNKLDTFDFDANIKEIAIAKLTEKISTFSLSGKEMSKYITDAMAKVIDTRIADLKFPPRSIPGSSIKQDELVITANQINGGILENFQSTGIDDHATYCVLTLLDDSVVIENNLLTKDITVQGNLIVNGNVPEDSPFYKQLTSSISATVNLSLNEDLFGKYSYTLFDKIKNDGIDLKKITFDGKTVLEANRLGFDVTESNLQKVGLLRELQVKGDTLLSNSLYTGNKRVGINTLEPGAALSIWDDDVEVNVSKLKANHAQIGTPRNQAITLSSNGKSNVVLNTDGSTEINDLRLGTVKVSSSTKPPSFVSTKGHVVFNANPTVGAPLGWICLGASSWANFGMID